MPPDRVLKCSGMPSPGTVPELRPPIHRNAMEIRGLIPATVTPFTPDGAINYEELSAHIRHVSAATDLFGICVNGHAGEVLALTSEERAHIVATAKKVVPRHLKIIAGIASHSLADLVQQGLNAKHAGA